MPDMPRWCTIANDDLGVVPASAGAVKREAGDAGKTSQSGAAPAAVSLTNPLSATVHNRAGRLVEEEEGKPEDRPESSKISLSGVG